MRDETPNLYLITSHECDGDPDYVEAASMAEAIEIWRQEYEDDEDGYIEGPWEPDQVVLLATRKRVLRREGAR